MAFTIDQWDQLIEATPALLGHSGLDKELLEEALANLSLDQKQAVEHVLHHGTIICAAKNTNPESHDFALIVQTIRSIRAATEAFAQEFNKVLGRRFS